MPKLSTWLGTSVRSLSSTRSLCRSAPLCSLAPPWPSPVVCSAARKPVNLSGLARTTQSSFSTSPTTFTSHRRSSQGSMRRCTCRQCLLLSRSSFNVKHRSPAATSRPPRRRRLRTRSPTLTATSPRRRRRRATTTLSCSTVASRRRLRPTTNSVPQTTRRTCSRSCTRLLPHQRHKKCLSSRTNPSTATSSTFSRG